MANQVALAPTLESITVTETSSDIPFPDLESRRSHPFSPWGPVTKFYVRFTVNPVRQILFQLNGRSESRYIHFEPLSTGVVLAREYDGGGANLRIWSGQIVDGLINVGGINVELAQGVVKSVHDWLTDPEMNWRGVRIGIDVEMRVLTPVAIPSGNDLSSSSSIGICG